MKLHHVMATLQKSSPQPVKANTLLPFGGINLYPFSVRIEGDTLAFIGRETSGKYLYVLTEPGLHERFDGEPVSDHPFGHGVDVQRSPMNHKNATMLREKFRFTRPACLGLADSFGFGDRLGIANPAHIRALSGSHMRPVLAQQSIRELERTGRTAEDVLDAASWAVFQEGYTSGFGADGDHLKTTDDIDRYARAGFTMYTFDPSAFVVNEAATLPLADVVARIETSDFGDLHLDDVRSRYAQRSITLGGSGMLEPDPESVARALLKYGGVVAHTVKLYNYLTRTYASLTTEVELSVDETDCPTTPFEHYFIASELKRQGVRFVSLAPRFIGDFEKGVDYRGDLTLFEREYRQHLAIATMVGPYKISIHSGSDKFGVYRVIGSLQEGNVHVKTAGTSYLEALRTVATTEPELLRGILDFARENYDEQRKSYHVTGRLDKVPSGKGCTNGQLLGLFDQHDARQVLHVTFGKVLSTRGDDGAFLFRDRFMRCLDQHEDVHYETIQRHFKKHLDPFMRH